MRVGNVLENESKHEIVHLETAIPDLYSSVPEPLPFDRSLDLRAYLLRRDAARGRGNLLLYSVFGLGAHASAIAALGGVRRHYLGHRHEAMLASDWSGAPLWVHADELEATARVRPVAGTFATRHRLDDDFEIVPIPGHTRGSTAYLWDSGRHRFLFTGDTIYLHDGEWVAAVLRSSDRAAYLESLALLRELEFDVLVPWAATRGRPHYAVTASADARRRIDAILDRVRRGEDR
jgi:glyoxylase-like metal-dependent hydrolase (beta-lactamase superfamily II)